MCPGVFIAHVQTAEETKVIGDCAAGVWFSIELSKLAGNRFEVLFRVPAELEEELAFRAVTELLLGFQSAIVGVFEVENGVRRDVDGADLHPAFAATSIPGPSANEGMAVPVLWSAVSHFR